MTGIFNFPFSTFHSLKFPDATHPVGVGLVAVVRIAGVESDTPSTVVGILSSTPIVAGIERC